MNRPIYYAVYAMAGLLALANPASAAEPKQVSGTEMATQVESHFIPSAGDPARGFTVAKWVGATSSPGWFDSMQETNVEQVQMDLKLGRADIKGLVLWANNDGTVTGSYAGKADFTMDEKTNTPKGSAEGTFEINGGTGHFANASGHGTWKGNFTGVQYRGQWSGTVTMLQKQAARQ